MPRALLLCAMLLAACSGPTFDGEFTGLYRGQLAEATLKQEGETLSGQLKWAGLDAAVRGTVKEGFATGNVVHVPTNFDMPFEATLKNDGIDWVYRSLDSQGTEIERTEIRFDRRDEQKLEAARLAALTGLDEAVVGDWYYVNYGKVVDGKRESEEIHMSLAADGTYVFGGAWGAVPGAKRAEGAGKESGPHGRWRSLGGMLAYQPMGAGGWLGIGHYTLIGGNLHVYTADGGHQIWRRPARDVPR